MNRYDFTEIYDSIHEALVSSDMKYARVFNRHVTNAKIPETESQVIAKRLRVIGNIQYGREEHM